jgi:hypothetical protein
VDFLIAMPSTVFASLASLLSPYLACDADSRDRLREETLKSLVHIVDKLEENQLQDKLVRCISNLQQDPENSIRTNATIFMSRIMPKLKDSVRSLSPLPSMSLDLTWYTGRKFWSPPIQKR